MPMIEGKSKGVVSENIREFHKGKTYARTKRKYGKKKADKQAVAASMEQRRRSGKRSTRRRT